MERKIEIPKMAQIEIAKWYENIKPIVQKAGETVYLRQLNERELTGTVYTRLTKELDYGDKVDFYKLSVLANVKMLHVCNSDTTFEPTVGEVISQIPEELLEKTVAFQIIYSPSTRADLNLFKEELDAGFHVSVVQLYQARDNSKRQIGKVGILEDNVPPIGMTEEKFAKLKELVNFPQSWKKII